MVFDSSLALGRHGWVVFVLDEAFHEVISRLLVYVLQRQLAHHVRLVVVFGCFKVFLDFLDFGGFGGFWRGFCGSFGVFWGFLL